ncbi:MAG: L,D-transpeptidase [Bacteroidetes bacterium]|nr:L,D-transpeptidase [Bacteroidota bacterium]
MTFLIVFSIIGSIVDYVPVLKQSLLISKEELDFLPIQNVRIKDTIFVQGNSYVEISLKEQLCRLYLKDTNNNTNCKVYKISSGNPNIFEGLETPTGLFTVQTKNPLGISKQFNNAELHNWVGFNVNFGIHGLAGNGYYNHLGHRASSHGCVRISRENGKELYDNVRFGTPVLVYSDEPAIALKFIDTITSLSKYYILPANAQKHNPIIRQRLQNIYDGLILQNDKKLLMTGETVIRWGGYRIGNTNKIPYKQKIVNPTINIFLLKDNVKTFVPEYCMESNEDSETSSE